MLLEPRRSVHILQHYTDCFKLGKSDGSGLSSDHWVHAVPAIAGLLASLFTSIILHVTCLSLYEIASWYQSPKGQKDPTISDNYWLLPSAKPWSGPFLLSFLSSFPLAAFSFVSRKVCLPGVLKNTISQYIHHGSSVFSCFLDASKAFDLVDHGILFKKLMARGLPPVITRTILSWYVDQSMRVRWNYTLSLPFQVSNGVRQGGVLWPILFTMYVDDLYFLACNNWVLAVIGVQILLVQSYTQMI